MKTRKTEHPILMCGEMVRAILAGTKTETRRIIDLKKLEKWPGYWSVDEYGKICVRCRRISDYIVEKYIKCPYGVAGDTLWVRETFAEVDVCTNHEEETWIKELVFRADNHSYVDDTDDAWPQITPKWKPSLFMRKEKSRITLTVKDVTLERLHSITDEGARSEGVKDRAEYEKLWKEINGEESWSLNPWVWVVKFEVKEVRK